MHNWNSILALKIGTTPNPGFQKNGRSGKKKGTLTTLSDARERGFVPIVFGWNERRGKKEGEEMGPEGRKA